jgi:magnesium transporter
VLFATSRSAERIAAFRETLLVIFGLEEGTPERLSAALARVAPEEVAAVLGDFSPEEKIRVFRALPGTEEQGVVLEEADQKTRRDVLEGITEEERRRIIGDMSVDDLVDHLEALEPAEQKRLIASLGKREARDVQELLAYEPDTAGGMMTTEFLTIPLGSTSRQALEKIQGNLGVEVISYVYLTDEERTLRGVVSIREILRASPATPVDSYADPDVVRVGVETDQEEVAKVFDKYNLTVVPVVDGRQRIRGIVTVDDVIDALQEEHSEDMLLMAGTTAVHPLHEPIRLDVLKRLPFLMITMLGGLIVATTLDFFANDVIGIVIFSKMVIWVHLVSALSGNVAVVTSTVLVRGLATGYVSAQGLRRALLREVLVGALVAVILATLAGLEIYAFGLLIGEAGFGAPRVILALVLGMAASVAWAGLVGAVIPIACRLSRAIDPALASGPFVTITCDISASLIFLLIISLVVGGEWPG